MSAQRPNYRLFDIYRLYDVLGDGVVNLTAVSMIQAIMLVVVDAVVVQESQSSCGGGDLDTATTRVQTCGEAVGESFLRCLDLPVRSDMTAEPGVALLHQCACIAKYPEMIDCIGECLPFIAATMCPILGNTCELPAAPTRPQIGRLQNLTT